MKPAGKPRDGVGVPAGEEWPMVYDAAFSASAHGKIRVFQQRGQVLPAGWALDVAPVRLTPDAALNRLVQQLDEVLTLLRAIDAKLGRDR